jgi:SAM-dependent methyltransferase
VDWSGPVDYDAELHLHYEVLRRACGVDPREQVLDIGCGAGQTTREAARAAVAGGALGVDISAPAIERAREIALAQGLRNVTFERGDAQTYRFAQERFDLAMSRFGTMFFADPVAAFGNIGRAWERNEWDVAIRRSLAGPGESAAAGSGGPDPFSLADPATVRAILAAAGFSDVTFTDVHEPVYYGADVSAALDWVRGFACTSQVIGRLDPAGEARAVSRLREMLAAHLSDNGVWLDSRAWVISSRRK